MWNILCYLINLKNTVLKNQCLVWSYSQLSASSFPSLKPESVMPLSIFGLIAWSVLKFPPAPLPPHCQKQFSQKRGSESETIGLGLYRRPSGPSSEFPRRFIDFAQVLNWPSHFAMTVCLHMQITIHENIYR